MTVDRMLIDGDTAPALAEAPQRMAEETAKRPAPGPFLARFSRELAAESAEESGTLSSARNTKLTFVLRETTDDE